MIKILLVDDNELKLKSLRNSLRSNGYTVHAFTCSLKALEASRGNNYDLIVSDFHLACLDGIRLIQRVRSNQPQIKSILISGYITQQTLKIAYQAGVNHYVSTPIHITGFLQTIHDIIK